MDLTDVSTKVDPENDEVFISGLPADVTEQEIADFFGQIGIIKQDKKRRGMPKVWMYKDKMTGELNGDATITYEDPFAAMSAPKWFDGKEFKGAVIKVSMSNRKAEAAIAYEKKMQERGAGQQRGYEQQRGDYRGGRGGGGRGGGGRGGGSGGRGRPGDWTCPKCSNNCFARKDTCNRCGTPKPRGGRGDSEGGYRSRDGDWRCSCGNNCFGWRESCNRCGEAKPGGGDRSRRPDHHNRGYRPSSDRRDRSRSPPSGRDSYRH